MIPLCVFQCAGNGRRINVQTKCTFRTVEECCNRQNAAAAAGVQYGCFRGNVFLQRSHTEPRGFMGAGSEGRARFDQKESILCSGNIRMRFPDGSDDQIIGYPERMKAVFPFILPKGIILNRIGYLWIGKGKKLLHFHDTLAESLNQLLGTAHLRCRSKICIPQRRAGAVKFPFLWLIFSFGVEGQDRFTVIRSQVCRDIRVHLFFFLRSQGNMVGNFKSLYA